MQQGWISLHRSLQDHWIWKNPVKLKWWIDILLTVNHIDGKINVGNKIITCKRGQSIMSLQSWATRWNVSKDVVRCFLKLLEKDKMISLENLTKTTRITVCNYDSYQDIEHDEQTQTQRKLDANSTQTHPNNNDNNILLSKDSVDFESEKFQKNEKSKITSLESDIEISDQSKKQKREKSTKEKKKKEEVDPEKIQLNKKAKEIFMARYFMLCNTQYYWTAKDAGNMSRLIQAIQHKFTQEDKIFDSNTIESELVSILNTALEDKWISQHFSTSIIYSKFNDIEAARNIKYNKKTTVYGIK